MKNGLGQFYTLKMDWAKRLIFLKSFNIAQVPLELRCWFIHFFLMPCCSKNKFKVFVCLPYRYLTNSENSFSNPFQRPYLCGFDRVKIHTAFEGRLFSNISIKNSGFIEAKS
jgi:hypothetical protein